MVESKNEKLVRYSSDVVKRGLCLAKQIQSNKSNNLPDPQPHEPKVYASDLYLEASAKFDQGNYLEALKKLNQALEIQPSWAEAFCKRGIIKNNIGEFANAIQDFNQALNINPYLEVAYYNRANSHFILNNYQQALKDCNQALIISSNFISVCILRGAIQKEMGDYQEALEDYHQALKLSSNYAESYYGLADLYFDLKDYHKAITNFTESLRIQPKNFEAYHNRGLSYQQLGDLKSAIEDYTNALNIDPKSSLSYRNRGLAHQALGELESALADYTCSLKLDPKNSELRAELYANRGRILHQLGDRNGAIKDYDLALMYYPDNGHIYILRGVAYMMIGEFIEAEEDVRYGLQISSLTEELLDEKIKDFIDINTLKECFPQISQMFSYIGDHHYELDNNEDAIKDYAYALSLDPNNTEIYNNLTNAWLEIEDDGETINRLRESIELNIIKNTQSTFLIFIYALAQVFRSIERLSEFEPDIAHNFREGFLNGFNTH